MCRHCFGSKAVCAWFFLWLWAHDTFLGRRPLVIPVREPETAEPRTAFSLTPDKDSGETQFLVAAFPPPVPPRERMPVEMLYMIDVSGSMSGTSIEQARSALLEALDRLRPVDR